MNRNRISQNQGVRLQRKNVVQHFFRKFPCVDFSERLLVNEFIPHGDSIIAVGVPQCLLADFRIEGAVVHLREDDPPSVQLQKIIRRKPEVRIIVGRDEREFLVGHRLADEKRILERAEQRGNPVCERIVMGEADDTFHAVSEQVVHIAFDRLVTVMNQTYLQPSAGDEGMVFDG